MLSGDQPDIALEVFKTLIGKGGRLNMPNPVGNNTDVPYGSSRSSSRVSVWVIVGSIALMCLAVR